MRVLVLGGTGFIGMHHLRVAVDRGHDVAVFGRGTTDVHLPHGVERLVGDRRSDLTAIRDRTWDAVVDLATYQPLWIRTLGVAMKGRVRHYTFISSISVYDSVEGNATGTLEEDRLLEYNDPGEDAFSPTVFFTSRGDAGSFSSEQLQKMRYRYGPLKVVCEREAERQFPGRVLIIRPGYITGPKDPQPWLSYWLERLELGGEAMVVGDPQMQMQVQFIDVRDLAEWVIRMAERGETGVYNAVGPAIAMTLAEMLDAILSVTAVPARLTWVAPSWLVERIDDVAMWRDVLFWSLAPNRGSGNTMHVRAERAIEKGLSFRAFTDTAYGVRQGALASADSSQVSAEWGEYLKREHQVLEEWHRQRDP